MLFSVRDSGNYCRWLGIRVTQMTRWAWMRWKVNDKKINIIIWGRKNPTTTDRSENFFVIQIVFLNWAIVSCYTMKNGGGTCPGLFLWIISLYCPHSHCFHVNPMGWMVFEALSLKLSSEPVLWFFLSFQLHSHFSCEADRQSTNRSELQALFSERV